MDDIAALKKRLGELMKESADGVGALTREDTSQSRKCIEDFVETAGDEIYSLLKKTTEFYAGVVSTDPGWPGCPPYIVMDDERGWASWLMSDIVGN